MTLTRRERAVLRHLASGAPKKAVAAELGVSEQTVKRLAHEAYVKLDAACLVEAMQRLGWVHVDCRTPRRITRHSRWEVT